MGEGKGSKEKEEVEEEVERGNWDNQCDFFLSCLGYAVGLGNVWRFPYLCYEHGGVTFLIAYVVMLLISGLPLFFLELALGQYAGKGPLKLFGRMTPGLKGLGYGMLIISFLTVIYYNMIIAWTIYYTFAGFSSVLPWKYCGNSSFTSVNCFQKQQELDCFNTSDSSTYWNKQCTDVDELCRNFNMSLTLNKRDDNDRLMCNNGTHDLLQNQVYQRISPSEDYFKRTMLGLDDDITWSNMGTLKWDLVLCLIAAWTIVCLCLIKGVQSSGKVVYFTALFPYLVLVILLIRGATLPGAYKGILFYVYPTTEALEGLQNVAVWSAAATQIFYSLGPSFGGLITLASYNKFTNNCHRDAILIAFSNCGTSIFAGFVIFSIIGFMADQAGAEVKDVIKGGTGLAFIAYPEAVANMPVPQLWSFLFFGMLITLGLDSQFTMTETITTAVMDQWPQLRAHKGKVVIGASVVGCILGLTMCTQGGLYMFELINWYSASWGLLICAIVEILAVMYGFGAKNFMNAIKEMEIKMPAVMKYYWFSMWMAITPICLLFVLIMTLANYSPAYAPSTFTEKYVFPAGIQALGWMMALVPAFAILAGWGYMHYHRRQNHKSTSFKAMTSPNEKWGPATITNAVRKPANHYIGNINEGFKYTNNSEKL